MAREVIEKLEEALKDVPQETNDFQLVEKFVFGVAKKNWGGRYPNRIRIENFLNGRDPHNEIPDTIYDPKKEYNPRDWRL